MAGLDDPTPRPSREPYRPDYRMLRRCAETLGSSLECLLKEEIFEATGCEIEAWTDATDISRLDEGGFMVGFTLAGRMHEFEVFMGEPAERARYTVRHEGREVWKGNLMREAIVNMIELAGHPPSHRQE